jgi:hypothetical protein
MPRTVVTWNRRSWSSTPAVVAVIDQPAADTT